MKQITIVLIFALCQISLYSQEKYSYYIIGVDEKVLVPLSTSTLPDSTFLNQTSTVSNNYIIDTNLSETTINLSTYQNGIYTIVLVCDGVARDAKKLVIQ